MEEKQKIKEISSYPPKVEEQKIEIEPIENFLFSEVLSSIKPPQPFTKKENRELQRLLNENSKSQIMKKEKEKVR